MQALLAAYAARALAHDPADAVRRALAGDDAGLVPRLDALVAAARRRLPDPDRSTASHWRAVYIDAAILAALARASLPAVHERECIAILDHAIVIAGAGVDEARRDYIVHDVIKHLQATIPCRPPSDAVLVAGPGPAPHPPPTAGSGVRALAALPSIATAHARWSTAPFVVRGHAEDWPGLRRWPSLPYLFSVAGPGRAVPVEVGDDYRSDDWSQKLIPWEEFLSSLESPAGHALYLAQHNLLAQFPQLRHDIVLPEIVYASLDAPDFPAYEPPSDVIINAWLGPKGTVSPAHTDPFFNCYVQVVGRKTVWMAPPSVAAAMYPYQPCPDGCHNPAANTTSPSMSNTSRVDVFPATRHETEASQTGFPLFWHVVPDKASCVTLNPGDLLFFPPGWWHAMRSEDVSFSVSMWF